jgi:hypothetical protein
MGFSIFVKMEKAGSSETVITIYQTTQHIYKHSFFYFQFQENYLEI